MGRVVPLLIDESKIPALQALLNRAGRTWRGTGIANVLDTPSGVVVDVPAARKAPPPRPSAAAIAFAKVTGFQDDYIECVFHDPVTEVNGAVVNVAKFFAGRRFNFDGITISYPNGQDIEYTYSTQRKRTADDGVQAAHEQVMTPDYYVDDVIRIIGGNTGLNDLAGAGIIFEDVNTAGRHWAREP